MDTRDTRERDSYRKDYRSSSSRDSSRHHRDRDRVDERDHMTTSHSHLGAS